MTPEQLALLRGAYPTMLDYLRAWPYLVSREGKTVFASGSELRRWFDRGSVEVDGVKAAATDRWPEPNQRVIIHPNGKHRTTLQ